MRSGRRCATAQGSRSGSTKACGGEAVTPLRAVAVGRMADLGVASGLAGDAIREAQVTSPCARDARSQHQKNATGPSRQLLHRWTVLPPHHWHPPQRPCTCRQPPEAPTIGTSVCAVWFAVRGLTRPRSSSCCFWCRPPPPTVSSPSHTRFFLCLLLPAALFRPGNRPHSFYYRPIRHANSLSSSSKRLLDTFLAIVFFLLALSHQVSPRSSASFACRHPQF